MPTKKTNKGLTLPSNSLTLTLIATEEWDNSKNLIKRLYKSGANFQRGIPFACCEKFGGNTLQCNFVTITVTYYLLCSPE